MFANKRTMSLPLPLLLLVSLVSLLASPVIAAPHANNVHLEERGRLTGRAAFNPFSPERFHAAGHQGQQDQIRRELGGRLEARTGRTKRMVVRKRKECAVKTSTGPAATTATSVSAGVPTGTGAPGGTSDVEALPSTTATTATFVSVSVSTGSGSTSATATATAAAAATNSLPVQNVPVVPTPTTTATSTSTSASTAITSTTSAAPAPTSGFESPDSDGNGPFSGSSTYYVLGTDGNSVGACGGSLVDSDSIAAASEYIFDSWPGSNGNPNQNPICGQYAKVSYQGKSVVVRIEDRCPGCAKRQLDLSPSAFSKLADFSVGMMDVTWEWVGSASG